MSHQSCDCARKMQVVAEYVTALLAVVCAGSIVWYLGSALVVWALEAM